MMRIEKDYNVNFELSLWEKNTLHKLMSDFNQHNNEIFMKKAIDQARIALSIGEVPVGCVIVHDGDIIGHGHNMTVHSRNVSNFL